MVRNTRSQPASQPAEEAPAPRATRKRAAAAPAPSPPRAAQTSPARAPRASPDRPADSLPKRRRVAVVEHEPLRLPENDEGEVYVMGSGETGQLGLGPDTLEKERPGRLNELRGKGIVDVVAGGMSSFAVSRPDDQGKQHIYSWGCNDQGALGRDTSANSDLETMCNFEVQGLEDAGLVVQIVAGDSVTLALTEKGHLYGTGTFRDAAGIFGFLPGIRQQNTFVRLDFLRDRFIISVALGSNHVVAVDDQGFVYTWGVGEQGQLGRRVAERRKDESSLVPRRINFRSGRKLVRFSRVYGGAYHTLLVTEDGREVYSMGLNNYGQLGLGHTENMMLPERIVDLEIPEGVKVRACAGGEHHSMILLDNGDLYGFGRNDSNQLGIPKDAPADGAASASAHVPVPTKLPDLPPVRQVSCGGAFTLAVTEELDLWGWGYGERGQLGSEGAEDVETPEQIEIRQRKCVKVSAGGQHTVMLILPKEAE
ncbi:regulator of chromosome condensation 1/beta-lactamase-inhibitor protein II [Hyaloraphidium curvatum]|nr:regulator of chromosome condensation 1/beta-lactamase-inhibitor protein II [Hyaloraphidium curvatum]